MIKNSEFSKDDIQKIYKTIGKNVKKIREEKGFYWVYAEISGVYKDGKLVEYKSIRTPISFKEKVEHQLLYDKMKKDSNEPTRKVIYK